MLAMHQQIDRVKAERLLDLVQVQTYPNLKKQDRQSFFDGLLRRAQGVMTEAAAVLETVNWNGRALGARALKWTASQAFGKGAVS